MNNALSHFRSINNEPLSLVIRQDEQCIEIVLKQIMRNTIRLLIKHIVLTSLFIYLVNYYFQFSSTLINLFFVVCLSVLLFRSCTQVVEESLLIQSDQDAKIKYSYQFLIGLRRDKFISSRKIIINEGIIYNRVIYYMGVMLLDDRSVPTDERVFPLFCKLLPRLDCLKCIYTSVEKFMHPKIPQERFAADSSDR